MKEARLTSWMKRSAPLEIRRFDLLKVRISPPQSWETEKKAVPTVSLQPKAGMAICFYHNILHQGGNVVSGQKYIMRTDVLFERLENTGVAPSSKERQALEYLQLGEDMERAKKFDLAVKYYSTVRFVSGFLLSQY